MAACLISTTGTSGYTTIQYKLGSNIYTTKAYVGDSIYIDDTATDVVFVTEEGDAVSSSLCLTVTEVTETCYKLQWTFDNSVISKYKIDQLILGATTYDLPDIHASNSSKTAMVGSYINGLGLFSIKAVAYKNTAPGIASTNVSYTFEVRSADIPELRMFNTIDNTFIYIKGEEVVDCFPSGYSEVVTCQTSGITTTTTLAP